MPDTENAVPAGEEAGQEVEETGATTTPEEATDAAEDRESKDETPAWLKREMKIERDRRRAAEAEAAELRKAVLHLVKPGEGGVKPAPSGPPKMEDFEDYEKYTDALVDWKLEQRTAKQAEAEAAKTEEAKARELVGAWEKGTETARGKYDDYDDVVFNPDLPVTEPMKRAILAAESGPDVAYFLGKNPKEAARIAGLDPIAAVMEIGKLAARMSKPEAAAVTSKAPTPIKPVGGKGAVNTDPDKMTTDEWMKWRNAQLQKKRG